MKRLRVIFFLLLTCIGHYAFTSPPPIKIPLITSLTGVASIPSFHLLQTAKMEVEQINKKGGIKGRKIDLVVIDDESNPLKTISIIKTLNLDNVVGVIGFSWSQFLLMAGPILQEKQIPSISILSTHDDSTKTGDFIFRVCFNDSRQGEVLAKFAVNEKHAKRAIIFTNQQNSYSLHLSKVIKEKYSTLGGHIVADIPYIPQHDENYFYNHLKMIDIKSYDAVFLPEEQIYINPIIMALRKIDGMNHKIFFGGDGWNMGNIPLKNSQFFNFEFYVIAHWDNQQNDKSNKIFIKNFRGFTNTEPQDASALSHDAIHLLVDAVKNAHSFNRVDIKNSILKTKIDGLTGNIFFNNSGDPVNKPVVLYRVYQGKRTAVHFK